MVRVAVTGELPAMSTDAGEIVQAIPGELFAQLRLTAPVNPFCGVTEIVVLPDCPGAEMLSVDGLADKL